MSGEHIDPHPDSRVSALRGSLLRKLPGEPGGVDGALDDTLVPKAAVLPEETVKSGEGGDRDDSAGGSILRGSLVRRMREGRELVRSGPADTPMAETSMTEGLVSPAEGMVAEGVHKEVVPGKAVSSADLVYHDASSGNVDILSDTLERIRATVIDERIRGKWTDKMLAGGDFESPRDDFRYIGPKARSDEPFPLRPFSAGMNELQNVVARFHNSGALRKLDRNLVLTTPNPENPATTIISYVMSSDDVDAWGRSLDYSYVFELPKAEARELLDATAKRPDTMDGFLATSGFAQLFREGGGSRRAVHQMVIMDLTRDPHGRDVSLYFDERHRFKIDPRTGVPFVDLWFNKSVEKFTVPYEHPVSSHL